MRLLLCLVLSLAPVLAWGNLDEEPMPVVEVAAAHQYSYWGQFLKMLVTLGLLVVLLVGVTWIYRKLGLRKALFGNTHSTIKILERRPISPKSTLYLLEVEGRRLVVGDSGANGVRLIADLQPAPIVTTPKFDDILKGKHKEPV